jgi:hypothetical protein
MDMFPMCVLILLQGKMLTKYAGFLRELLAKNECANNTAHKEMA